MLRLLLCVSLYVVIDAATTTPGFSTTTGFTTTMPAAKILYDMKHHKAIIVRSDGCYEYHMNHQDVLDHASDDTRAAMEVKILQVLAAATNIQETGHHHIDHMTQEIKTACASVPVFSFDQ